MIEDRSCEMDIGKMTDNTNISDARNGRASERRKDNMKTRNIVSLKNVLCRAFICMILLVAGGCSDKVREAELMQKVIKNCGVGSTASITVTAGVYSFGSSTSCSWTGRVLKKPSKYLGTLFGMSPKKNILRRHNYKLRDADL